jgi:hypothetical protein
MIVGRALARPACVHRRLRDRAGVEPAEAPLFLQRMIDIFHRRNRAPGGDLPRARPAMSSTASAI